MLKLTEFEGRDCPSGLTHDYPAADYLAVSGRYASYDLPDARDDAIVIPPWPARVEIPVAADPATPGADTSQALAAIQQIPRAERIWLAGRGVSVRVFDGPVTALPQFAYLAGRPIGLPGDQGRTYDGLPGLADLGTLTAYVAPGLSPHLVLHEVAHLLEPLLSPARLAEFDAGVLPALVAASPGAEYLHSRSELLAEFLARRWEGWPVPQVALDFYDGVFHGVPL